MFSSQQDLQTNLEYIRKAGVAHMMTVYKTDNRVLHEVEEMDPGVWIMMTNPTMEESQEVAEQYDIDMADVRAALDEEESSRIELEDGYTLILVDIPATEIRHESKNYTTIPLGILLTQECIITVCTEETPILQHFIERRVREFSTKKKMRFVYQILFRTAAMYQSTLRIIDKKRTDIEENIGGNTEDEDLVNLHELESTLVYFATSLRANGVVLERLSRYKRLEQYPEDTELLEDVIIENKQAIEMTNIYSGILSGTTEAFASIISNNLNIVMKFLATVTIVMSIPTMIFSAYGMNLKSFGMPFADNPMGFLYVILLSLVFSILVAIVFRKKDLF